MASMMTDTSLDPRDSERPVDLYYFDQLGRQTEKFKLSIQPGNAILTLYVSYIYIHMIGVLKNCC